MPWSIHVLTCSVFSIAYLLKTCDAGSEALSMVQTRASLVSEQLQVAGPSSASKTAITTTASKHLDHTGTLFAWVMFGKVGSTTMRSILTQRSKAHGWEVNRSDTDLLNGDEYDPALCFWGENTYMAEQPQSTKCANQPDNTIVMTTYYGYCQLVTHRPCKYVTLLREPVERLISEYSFFCLICAEGGVRCVVTQEEYDGWYIMHPGVEMPPKCPKISAAEWARRRNNPYVRRFNLIDQQGIQQGAWWNPGYVKDVKEEHYQSALKELTSPHMLVMFLDEFSEGQGGRPSALQLLGDFVGESTDMLSKAALKADNENELFNYKPTTEEVKELQDIMAFDLRLWNELRKPIE